MQECEEQQQQGHAHAPAWQGRRHDISTHCNNTNTGQCTQVHQGVEARVKAAMARAEELEAHKALMTAQHARQAGALQQQVQGLEAALAAAQQQVGALKQQLAGAVSAGRARVSVVDVGGAS